MTDEISARMIRRIAEIGRGNEIRTLDYITMGKTTAERQKELNQRRIESGQQRATFWATLADLNELREKFPGTRGGIDWQAVITKALGRESK